MNLLLRILPSGYQIVISKGLSWTALRPLSSTVCHVMRFVAGDVILYTGIPSLNLQHRHINSHSVRVTLRLTVSHSVSRSVSVSQSASHSVLALNPSGTYNHILAVVKTVAVLFVERTGLLCNRSQPLSVLASTI